MPARRSSSAAALPANAAAPLPEGPLFAPQTDALRDVPPPLAVEEADGAAASPLLASLAPADTTAGAQTRATSVDAREGRRSVLVAVVNNEADLQRAAGEGWYRIPQRSAPRRIGADYLALYLTSGAVRKGSSTAANTVALYAATRRYRLVTRRDLIPDEPNHPRAGDAYFRIDIGPLQ